VNSDHVVQMVVTFVSIICFSVQYKSSWKI